MQDEWFETLSTSFPHMAEQAAAEVKWLESRVRLWYQLLVCSTVDPSLRCVLKPYAAALFSGAKFKPRVLSQGVSEAQKAHLQANQSKIFKAALDIAKRGNVPTVETIAAEIGSSKKTVSKYGTEQEILLGAVAHLMHNL